MLIGLIGVGAMGEALLAGWLRAGVSPETVTIVDPARAEEVAARRGVRAAACEEAAKARLVFLAVKPARVGEVARAIAEHLSPESVVVSIAAGVSLARLAELLPGARVVRVMPNTPALVGRGMAAVTPGPGVGDDEVEEVLGALRAVGDAVVVGEQDMDAVVALSGSGPAYLFHVAEAMIEAGVHLGLGRQLAARLVGQTFVGSAHMLTESGASATELREAVTSPGGTTAAALGVLDERAVRAAVIAASKACAGRSRELSGD